MYSQEHLLKVMKENHIVFVKHMPLFSSIFSYFDIGNWIGNTITELRSYPTTSLQCDQRPHLSMKESG